MNTTPKEEVKIAVPEQEKAQQPTQVTPVAPVKAEESPKTGKYCFKCKSWNPLNNVVETFTAFRSTRRGIPMQRKTIIGNCSSCGKSVHSFEKGEKIAKVDKEDNAKPIIPEPPKAEVLPEKK